MPDTAPINRAMSRPEFYRLVEGVIEEPAGSLKGDTPLADFPLWDSMALVGLIAAIDKELGVTVPARQLIAARTADDIATLLGDKVAAA